MRLHIVKLCVGCDSVEDLVAWQRQRLKDLAKTEAQPELMHVTRQTPRKTGFSVGSSIYWVMGGFIRARQTITALREVRGADASLDSRVTPCTHNSPISRAGGTAARTPSHAVESRILSARAF